MPELHLKDLSFKPFHLGVLIIVQIRVLAAASPSPHTVLKLRQIPTLQRMTNERRPSTVAK
jgi:hypothetical protein